MLSLDNAHVNVWLHPTPPRHNRGIKHDLMKKYAPYRGILHASFTVRIFTNTVKVADPKQVLVYVGISNRIVSLRGNEDLLSEMMLLDFSLTS